MRQASPTGIGTVTCQVVTADQYPWLASGTSLEAALIPRWAVDGGYAAMIRRFDDPAQPYLSRSAPQFVKKHMSDYDHLARVFEWSTSGEEGEE